MSNISRFVETGRKIIGVGRNYRAHALELGNEVPAEPVVFLKPTSSYISEGESIKLPKGVKEVHHEVELGVVISKKGRMIPEAEAFEHVGGYFLALDMTDRVAQQVAKKKGLPWSLAKGFDTSCPVSSFIPIERIKDPHDVNLWLEVNGDQKQNGNTKDMIFRLSNLISWISEHFMLEPGDTILTGTPEGVGPVRAGDRITCGLADIVKMSFPVETW